MRPEPAMDYRQVEEVARRIRRSVLAMAVEAGGAHMSPAFSLAEILSVIYGRHLSISPDAPEDPDRDRLVLSKGHGCAGLFATLAEFGFLEHRELRTFCRIGSRLGGHPDVRKVPGVEASTGSLGHGLSIAIGMAYAAKLDARPSRIFAILGDGECQEGSIWEGAMAAAQLGLDNLIAIVDANGLQGMGQIGEINDLEPFPAKWASFGWAVQEVDGHDVEALDRAIDAGLAETGRPSAIIARTVKGKGLSFMEGEAIWHYRLPDETELVQACSELGIEDLEEVLR
jgi:transketolase